MQQEFFGGSWTQKKLECLSKYLTAYTTIFKQNPKAKYFRISYVDAFAGTGHMPGIDLPLSEMIPELAEGAEEYQKGSVIRALEVEPGFDQYIFIERDLDRSQELRAVKKRFPDKDILIETADANDYLQSWCKGFDSRTSRAVLFLDPFGMSVEWTIIELIAKTRAIDLWVLFPMFAVNRMLVRGKKPPESWKRRLTMVFGTEDWEHEFYAARETQDLLGQKRTEIEKVADYNRIGQFFLQRLKQIFVDAAEPLVLKNSRNSPLYLFCFAAGNDKGATTGLRIAKDIIGN